MTTARVGAAGTWLAQAWYHTRVFVFYWLCTYTMRLLLFLFTDWQVIGRENVPRTGPLLVVANHNTYLDPPVLSSALKRRRIVFVAKEELWSSSIGWVVEGFGALSIRRGELDREALRRSLAILQKGKVLGMFPEGTRSLDHRVQKAEPGTAYLALRAGVPILPVGVAGSHEIFPHGKRWPQRVRVVATIGKPFQFPPLDRAQQRERMSELGDLVMQRIAELLPESYR